jgi:hypothetical protein
MEDAMRKMRLDLDQLAIESFATTDGGAEKRGTVQGRAGSGDCLGTLYQSPCVSLTADLECYCVQTQANQLSCNVVCESAESDCLSISGHLDCPCRLTV